MHLQAYIHLWLPPTPLLPHTEFLSSPFPMHIALWRCTWMLAVVGDLYSVCMFAFQKHREGDEAAWSPSLFLVGLKIQYEL
jgi:hypothetical protein